MLTRSRIGTLGSLVLAGAGSLAACSSSGSTSPTASSSQTAAANVPAAMTPAWATPSNYAGPLEATTSLSLQVHLLMHDLDDAKATLAAISDPSNARYAQFLSDAEFASQYGPTADDVATVRAHLESHGLTVTYVPANNAFLSVRGIASNVESAFGTRLGLYNVGGELRRAPMSPVSLPAAMSARVFTVLGLSTPRVMKPAIAFQGRVDPDANPSAAATPTCSEWFGQIADTTDPAYGGGFPSPLTYTPCGFHPAQLRQGYGIDALVRKGNDGTGQKVAIIDAFVPPTLVQDAQEYFANNDADYPLASSQISVQWGPGTQGPVDKGWYGESALDVEAVHAMAPGAKIVYVGAVSADDQDLIAAVNVIITGHLASVISNSYDDLEQGPEAPASYAAWENVAIQAGLKGIGMYFASGDSGDESPNNNGTPTVDFPASLAEVTGVGGTTLGIGGEGQNLFQVGWEDGISSLEVPDGGADAGASWLPAPPGSYGFGAGGGVSVLYLQPAYQKGIVPASLSTYIGAVDRTVPDVAMDADPYTGYFVGLTSSRTGVYHEEDIGGTSLATPLFSATMALAEQYTGRTFGQANTALYKASKKGAFIDIAPTTPEAVAYGSDAVTFDYHGQGNTNATAVGYDTATGLGVPNGESFFKALK
jgi:subtilase family serine protease